MTLSVDDQVTLVEVAVIVVGVVITWAVYRSARPVRISPTSVSPGPSHGSERTEPNAAPSPRT